MGKAFETITDAMSEFVAKQHLFFVATAPNDGGHVNVSPKGLDSFCILGPDRVAYLDLTGSGAETIAHVRQNGRITFMFCAFDGRPNIVRFYGTATVVLPDDREFPDLAARFEPRQAVRSVIVADIDRTSNSCGYAVPLMKYVEDRTSLDKWANGRSKKAVERYWAEKNAVSIDGLPAVPPSPANPSSNPRSTSAS